MTSLEERPTRTLANCAESSWPVRAGSRTSVDCAEPERPRGCRGVGEFRVQSWGCERSTRDVQSGDERSDACYGVVGEDVGIEVGMEAEHRSSVRDAALRAVVGEVRGALIERGCGLADEVRGERRSHSVCGGGGSAVVVVQYDVGDVVLVLLDSASVRRVCLGKQVGRQRRDAYFDRCWSTVEVGVEGAELPISRREAGAPEIHCSE
jgi:hypothetical protein